MYLYEEKTICGKTDKWLELAKIKLSSLPIDFYCDGSLSCDGSSMKELPSNLTIKGNLYIGDCDISKLPSKLVVGGDLILLNSSIFDLPDDICLCGNIVAIKANNIPKYQPNTVYDNFVCDKNGKIIPFKYSRYVKREPPNGAVRLTSYTFYHGVFGIDAVSYGEQLRVLSCKNLKDGTYKIDYDALRNSPVFEKYYNYDVNQKRFVKELVTIFKDITDACIDGINEYLAEEKIVLTNKYSITELNEMLQNKNFEKKYYKTTYVNLFTDYFFHRERFD